MMAITLLQRIYNLNDERVVALWIENPYFQFFFGEVSLQWQQPCAASDLSYRRKQARQRRYPYPLSTIERMFIV
jgi:IS5 family transposase